MATTGNDGSTLPPQSDPSGQSGQSSVNPLLGILATLGSALAGHAITTSAMNNAVPPELRQMLMMANQRYAYQNPEFQAVTQGMYSMLPTFARQGTSLSGSLSSAVPAAPSDSGGIPDWLKYLLAAGGGAAGAGLLGKLLGGNGAGSSFSFNNPFHRGFNFNPSTPGQPLLPGNPYDPTNPDSFLGWADPSGSPGLLTSDPGVYYGDSGGGAMPTDPSGGTGTGPGMSGYYDDGGGY